METLTAYWLNGTPYCLACVESNAPCMSDGEKTRSVREDGTGRCGCCGEEFALDAEAAKNG